MNRIIICENCGDKKPNHGFNLCAKCYNIIHKRKLIICKDCGKEKYHNAKGLCRTCYQKQNPRKIIICSQCKQEKPHKGYGLCLRCYRKYRYYTVNGFISKMYDGMIQRTKEKNYPELISRKEFYIFAQNSKIFLNLFQVWEKANHPRKLVPSIDRIDNNLGYSKNNIQFLTQSENAKKSKSDVANCAYRVKIILHNQIYYFNSTWDASKYLNKCCEYIGSILRNKFKAPIGMEVFKVSREEYILNRYLDPYFNPDYN
jgi:ribosomal protein L37E